MSDQVVSIILPDSKPDKGIVFEHEGHVRRVFGGSFFHAPHSDEYIKINLMAEYANLPSDISFPIVDFSFPSSNEPLRLVFEDILTSDKDVYVGCFGGKGRTGLFMAALLQYLGHGNPIEEVRAQYRPEAVETFEQEMFVRKFPVRSVSPSISVQIEDEESAVSVESKNESVRPFKM